jgi:hypothetical protein
MSSFNGMQLDLVSENIPYVSEFPRITPRNNWEQWTETNNTWCGGEF